MCVDNVARCRISLRTTKDKGVVGECHTTLVCVSGRTSSSCIILLEFVWLHMAGYAAKVQPLGTDRRILRGNAPRQLEHVSKRKDVSAFVHQTCLSKAARPTLVERRLPSQSRKRPRQGPACSSCGRSISSQASKQQRLENGF